MAAKSPQRLGWHALLNQMVADAKNTPFLDLVFHTYTGFGQTAVGLVSYFAETYRTYHAELELKDKEKRKRAKMVVTNVITVVKRWLKLDWMVLQNPNVLSAFNSWMDESSSPPLKETIRETMKKMNERCTMVDRFRERKRTIVFKDGGNGPPKVEKYKKPIQLDSIKIEELAQQITLWEFLIFSSIPPHELIERKWNRPDHQAPFVSYLLSWFDTLLRWLISEILEAGSVEHASRIICKIIGLGTKLKSLNNFNGLVTVLCALHSPVITRIHSCWSKVPQNKMTRMIRLTEIMSPEKNFEMYRKLLGEEKPPAIPFIGLIVSDMTYIIQQTQTEPPPTVDSPVDLKKARLIGSTLLNHLRFNETSYSFPSKRLFYDFFATGMSPPSMEELMELSYKIESQESNPDLFYDSYFSYPIVRGNEPLINPKFRAMTQQDWDGILKFASTCEYEDGKTVIEQGVWPNRLYLIKSGKALVKKKRGRRSHSRPLDEGKIFGEFSLYGQLASCASVIADGHLVTYAFDALELYRLFDSNPHIASRLYATLGVSMVGQLRELYAEIQSSSRRPSSSFSTTHSGGGGTGGGTTGTAAAGGGGEDEGEGASHHHQHHHQHQHQQQHHHHEEDGFVMGESVQFRKRFDLPENESLLKEWDCLRESGGLGEGRTLLGKMYVSRNFICHYSKIFNYETKEVLPTEGIQSIASEDLWLTILGHSGVHHFKFGGEEILEEAQSLLTTLCPSLQSNTIPTYSSMHDFFQEKEEERVSVSDNQLTLSRNFDPSKWKMGQEEEHFDHLLELGKDDWETICKTFAMSFAKPGEVILSEGSQRQRIIFIVEGCCRIEKSFEERTLQIGVIGKDGIAGEETFLDNQGAIFTVIAATRVKFHAIDGNIMGILFNVRPGLQNRFFRYLGSICADRIDKELRCEDEEDRMILDVIGSAEYLSLPPVLVESGPSMQSTSVRYINGSADSENGDTFIDTNYQSFVSARSITTYPFNQELNARLGTPICDYYCGLFFKKMAIVALADGCSWGPAPRAAAKNASEAFVRFLSKYQGRIHDVQYAGRIVSRAFSVAHSAIIRLHGGKKDEKDGEVNSWEIGTTTLFGGILVPLKTSFSSSTSSLPPSPSASPTPTPLSSLFPTSQHQSSSPTSKEISLSPNETASPLLARSPSPCSFSTPTASVPPKFAFVFGNVGDCKAFHYSPFTNQLSDITPEARVSSDATDCGGRLGPYIDGIKPDLRNFRIRFLPCVPGDLIIIMTDGVHDNLDPEHLGHSPNDITTPSYPIEGDGTWDQVDWKNGERMRLIYRLKALHSILFKPSERHSLPNQDQRPENVNAANTQKEPNRGRNITPAEVTNSLLQFCVELNLKATKWMEDHPSQKLPVNYAIYPGKMDHCSCIVFRVGTYEE